MGGCESNNMGRLTTTLCDFDYTNITAGLILSDVDMKHAVKPCYPAEIEEIRLVDKTTRNTIAVAWYNTYMQLGAERSILRFLNEIDDADYPDYDS